MSARGSDACVDGEGSGKRCADERRTRCGWDEVKNKKNQKKKKLRVLCPFALLSVHKGRFSETSRPRNCPAPRPMRVPPPNLLAVALHDNIEGGLQLVDEGVQLPVLLREVVEPLLRPLAVVRLVPRKLACRMSEARGMRRRRVCGR